MRTHGPGRKASSTASGLLDALQSNLLLEPIDHVVVPPLTEFVDLESLGT